MRRLLAVCVVGVAVFAAFAVAQNGPASATIVVTGQDYPSKYTPIYDPKTGAEVPAGPITVANELAPRALGAYSAFGADVYSIGDPLYSRNDRPNQVLQQAEAVGVLNARVHFVEYGPEAMRIGTGQAGFLGDGGAAISAEVNLSTNSLFERSGIAVAADGTLYIADTKNSTIRSVAGPSSSEPGTIRSVAGKWAPRQNVTLTEPMGLAVDRAGNLYIADHGAGAVDVLVAATGQLETLAHVVSPASIAVTQDGTKVFVASPETGGVFAIPTGTRAIEAVSGFAPTAATSASDNSSATGPCAAVGSTPASTASSTSASEQVCPSGLAVDGRGNLFVADANAGKILRVDAATNKTTVAVSGMITPGDIAFDSKGDLFVSEQGRSRIIAMGQLGATSGMLTLTAPAPPNCTQGVAFTYCNEPSGGVSAAFTFTLANTSATAAATALTITPPLNPATPGNFTVSSTGCTATLAANSSCLISVEFTPQTTGAITGSLNVTDSQGDSVTLNLAGTGDTYSLQLASGQTNLVNVVQGSTANFMAQVLADSTFGANGEKVLFVCPTNLPQFSTCAFSPCPLSVTAGTTTNFSIAIATSSNTASAPPVTPCTVAAGVAPGPGGPEVRGPQMFLRLAPETPRRGAVFPALLVAAMLALAAILALAFGGMRARGGASRRRAAIVFAAACLAAAIVAGCHGGANPKGSTATPTGITPMTMIGQALDSSGNPLNAGRPLSFSIDVLATGSK